MLHRSIVLIALAGLAAGSKAQLVATFTVVQPLQFEVDAGEDQVYEPGLTLQAAAVGGTSTYSYLWSPAAFVDDATSQTPLVLGLLGPTLFTVQVTDAGLGCTLVDQVFVDYTTDVSEVEAQALSIFPNPTDGLVRIQGSVAVEQVMLHSPNGVLMLDQYGMMMRDVVVDVSTLPTAVYFMTILFVDGRSQTHKLCTTSAR
ncbi:MAG: T9SS type A sorting domain-containing protein [Flavobacteriales bacterium]